MSNRLIDMNGLTSKKFVFNSQRGDTYHCTIQNESGQALTVTVTNDDIQNPSAIFKDPVSGPLAIADGVIGELDEPYDGATLTLAAAGSGFIYITEAG